MAESLFGNKYRQAVADESIVRQKLDSSGGLTGWAAITAAMGGLGGELGYQGGQMFGGQTPAQVQEAAFNSVIDSIPDFDPSNPDSLNEASSKYWQAGFYDEGMAMMNQSRTIQKDDALIELYKAQAKDELTIDGPSPTEVIAKDKALRIKEAALLVKGKARTTVDEMKAVSKILEDAGYTDTPEYKNLRTNMQSMINTELQVKKEIKTNEEQQERVEEADITLRYKPVFEVGKGTSLVSGYFLKNPPAGLGNEDTASLSKQIGGLIETYDNQLSVDRGSVSPGEAVDFYEKVLNIPEVYSANQENFQGSNPLDWVKGYRFDSELFRENLDKTFARKGKFYTSDEINKAAERGLIIPNVTVIELADGSKGTVTPEQLAKFILSLDVPN